ncbi:hypothetical protein IX51_00860 [uncultured archaeon]|nr:hypothetical protein IX51_00860 [uncultured archaeon]
MTSESTYTINGTRVTLFGGIKGLVSEGEALRRGLIINRPDVILITISEEHVEGLSEFMKDPFEMILSDYEIIYGVHLSVYGEVMTPPPIYTESVRYAEDNGIEIIGLDMNEGEFSKLYSKKVGTFALVRHSVRKRRLIKKEFKDRTPDEFVKSWEERVNNIRALREVDRIRVEKMENSLMEHLEGSRWKNAFVVVDFEFFDHFNAFLKAMPSGNE